MIVAIMDDGALACDTPVVLDDVSGARYGRYNAQYMAINGHLEPTGAYESAFSQIRRLLGMGDDGIFKMCCEFF